METNAFKWENTYTAQGDRDWSQTDQVVNYLKERPELLKNFRGHCTFWNHRENLPTHLKNASKQDIERAMFTDGLEVMRRYPEIKEWDVLNEPLDYYEGDQGTIFDPETDNNTFVELFKQAKIANPEAALYINETGLPDAIGNTAERFKALVEKMISQGAPVDGIGVQAHLGGEHTGLASLSQIKQQLDSIATIGLPIRITEMDATDKALGGETQRADYMKKVLTLMYSLPYINGIYLWGFVDKEHWRGTDGAGLFDDNLVLNEVGQAYFARLNTDWKTKDVVTTDDLGRAQFTGFKGSYSATPLNHEVT